MILTVTQAMIAGAVSVLAVMVLLWFIQLRTKNAGIVDLGWTFCVFLMAAFCFAGSTGDPTRKSLIFMMVLIWATRLNGHLTRRYFGHPDEDARYHKWRLEQKDKANGFFLFVFLFQGVLAIVLSVPFWIASADAKPGLRSLEYVALGLWGLAIMGESLADKQLARFKADPKNRGQVCQVGLWNYSRHPNYFFECILWIAYFLFAAGSPGGMWAATSPILMIFFIIKVSGLPPAEEQSLLSKGERYRSYQRTTSALIPWFKKRV